MEHLNPLDPGRIELKLKTVAQLFNSFDPSPFHEKDLDDDAEEYIAGTAAEMPETAPLTLVLHLPFEVAATTDVNALRDSIRNYFEYRSGVWGREIRKTLRQGRNGLLVGLVILFVAMALHGVVGERLPEGTLSGATQEGLLIAGWAAFWWPIQIFLYEWWPARSKQVLYRRLCRMEVEIRAI